MQWLRSSLSYLSGGQTDGADPSSSTGGHHPAPLGYEHHHHHPPSQQQQQQHQSTTAFGNLPPPPSGPGQSANVQRLNEFMFERCSQAGFNSAAVKELYALVAVFGDSAIDPSRVFASAGGDGRGVSRLNVPLVLSGVPVLLRVPAAYRDDDGSPSAAAASAAAAVSINVPLPDRHAGQLNPSATYVDPATYNIRVPQRSATLVSYLRELDARFQRTPPLASGWAAAPPTAQPQQAPNWHATAAATTSVINKRQVRHLLDVMLDTAHDELGIDGGQWSSAGDALTAVELMLPLFRAGRRVNVPVVCEGNTESPVALLRCRVKPPHGCVFDRSPGAPCDSQGYIVAVDASDDARRLERDILAGPSTMYAAMDDAERYRSLAVRVLQCVTGALNENFPYIDAASYPAPSEGRGRTGFGHSGSPYDMQPAPAGGSPYDQQQQPSSSPLQHPDGHQRYGHHDHHKESAPLPPPGSSGPTPPAAAGPAARPADHYDRNNDSDGVPDDVEPVAGDDDDDDVKDAAPQPPPQQTPPPPGGTRSPVAPQPAAAAASPADHDVDTADGDEDDLCVICLDAQRTHACVPCGHRVLCESCQEHFKNGEPCPTCRATVQATIKVYL